MAPCTTPHWVRPFAKVEQRIHRAAIAELVIEPASATSLRSFGTCTVLIDQPLGNDEQRESFGARNQLAIGTGNLGQHKVNDVFGDLVFSCRDPHFVAGESIARAEGIAREIDTIRFGASGDIAQALDPACGSDKHMVPSQRPVS